MHGVWSRRREQGRARRLRWMSPLTIEFIACRCNDAGAPACATQCPDTRAAPRLSALRQKMAHYQANGAQPGWLLIPEQQVVEVWPAQGEPQRFEGARELQGGALLPGLQIALGEIARD